ncbi:hypothetical protein [Haloferula sp. BvORR071]|uniref:hypothetical protein n=1 Tax=Haloferula sp. BvORR071 TaxID=1396141 RepID=UPI00055919FA|nr:hypothetical protein [Haloferula sp. BvORR071]
MIRLISLLALCLASILRAQDSGVQVSFLAESVPDSLGQVQMVADKHQSAAFDLSTTNISQPIVAPARSFKLRKAGKDEIVASVALPAAGKAFIVLLVTASEATYTPVAIPAKDPSFKPGDIYFYNHTDKAITGKVGTTTLSLEPNKGQAIKPQGAEDNAYEVAMNAQEEAGERAITKTRWPVDKNMRSYVLLFVNPANKRIDFRAIDEFVAPDKHAK